MVGLCDLRGFFQLKQFHSSLVIYPALAKNYLHCLMLDKEPCWIAGGLSRRSLGHPRVNLLTAFNRPSFRTWPHHSKHLTHPSMGYATGVRTAWDSSAHSEGTNAATVPKTARWSYTNASADVGQLMGEGMANLLQTQPLPNFGF